MNIIINLQANGMVVLSRCMGGLPVPVIWFESIEYFDEFIGACLTMSRYFKINQQTPDPAVKEFIESLDLTGI